MRDFEYKFGDRPLEGYTIQRAVGRGGFGEVYYAVSDSGRQVALKAIQGYEQIELRGVSQCMNLKNPHLVTIFDIRYGEGGRPFVIMEYVWGPSLRDLLDRSPGGLGPAKSAFFLREIATGLAYLHNCGIVHRDLKPGNIFCEDGCVKIGDYGLSKAMSASRASGQTITVGTVHYMAPEIGAGHYDRSVDIYALGIVLYEMLTGQVPFEGASPGEILMKHLSAVPKLEGIKEPFAGVLRRALDKDPDKRYATAREMADDLFKSEAIRASVATLPPEGLSMAGVRPQPVPPPLPSSPAAPPPPPPPADAPGARAARSRMPRLPVGVELVEAIANRLKDKAHRVQDHLHQKSERLHEKAEQVRSRFVGPPPVTAEATDVAQAAALDPVRTRVRRLLFVAAAFAMAVGTAMVDAAPSRHEIENEMLWAFIAILGAGFGIVVLRAGHALAKVFLIRRVLYGLAGFLPALVGMMVASSGVVMGIGLRRTGWLENSMLAIFVSLCIVNWHERGSPARPARIQLRRALAAGVVGYFLAACFNGDSVLVAGILAGVSLAVQAVMPLAPRQAGGYASPGCHASGSSAEACLPPAPEHASPQGGEAWQEKEAWHATSGWAGVGQPPAPGSPAAAGELGYRPAPAFLRGLSLVAFVILLAVGPLLLILSGTELRGGEFLLGLCAGLVAIEFAIFCLVKSCQRRFRSWWRSFIKPLLLVSCAAVATCAFVCSVGLVHHARGEWYLALFILFFSTILFIVIAAIPSRAAPPRPLPTPVAPPGAFSRKHRLTAMLLTFPFFCGLAGLHRFYVGKIGTGLLWLCTHGLLGIGQIYDFIMIVTGQFEDANGLPLVLWEQGWPMPTGAVAAGAGGASRAAVGPGGTPVRVAGDTAGAPTPSAAPTPLLVAAAQPLGAGRAMLLTAGGVLMATAILVGLAVAVNLPSFVGSGSPGPRLAGDLEFGQPGWPSTFHRVGMMLTALLMLLAAIALVVARRQAGPAHMIRVVAGVGGLLGSLCLLRDALLSVNWPDIATMARINHVDLAIEMFCRGVREGPALAAAPLFLISTIILAWPPRPRLETAVAMGGGR